MSRLHNGVILFLKRIAKYNDGVKWYGHASPWLPCHLSVQRLMSNLQDIGIFVSGTCYGAVTCTLENCITTWYSITILTIWWSGSEMFALVWSNWIVYAICIFLLINICKLYAIRRLELCQNFIQSLLKRIILWVFILGALVVCHFIANSKTRINQALASFMGMFAWAVNTICFSALRWIIRDACKLLCVYINL